MIKRLGHIDFVETDGGRSRYFKADKVGDCVTRAVSIATGRDYLAVYNELKELSGKSPRNGVARRIVKKYLSKYPFTALMDIGTGCKYHLHKNELPTEGSYILSLSGHLAAYKDGVLYDTYDSSRGGQRCVYGYWKVN